MMQITGSLADGQKLPCGCIGLCALRMGATLGRGYQCERPTFGAFTDREQERKVNTSATDSQEAGR